MRLLLLLMVEVSHGHGLDNIATRGDSESYRELCSRYVTHSQDLFTKTYIGKPAPTTLKNQLPGMGLRLVLLVVTKTLNPSF